MRTRTNPAIVRYGLYMYFNSRSFRLAAKSLAEVKKRSHVAIWKWVQRYAHLADRFRIDRRQVRRILFVDETLLKIDGHEYWLWIAYEPDQNKCLLMHLSRERTILVCYLFFQKLRTRFGRKPVFTDGGKWYSLACRWLRLKHQVYGTGLKNIMERFIQHIKDRTECFDDHFPCRKPDCNRQPCVDRCMELAEIIYSVPAFRHRQNIIYSRFDGGDGCLS
jgi:putative transposase